MSSSSLTATSTSATTSILVAADEPELIWLCRTRQWNSAIARAAQCPTEEAFASFFPHGTAIATACRYSAPAPVIYSLADAIKRHMQNFPEMSSRSRNPLRINAGGRGTPLHEAMSNEDMELGCLLILIRTDNQIEIGDIVALSAACTNNEIVPPRAIHAQDVDGQTPLHLLVRRIFRSCPRPLSYTNSSLIESALSVSAAVTQDDYDSTLLSVLDELIEAYPQGCLIPDHREYEETPLVLALKASLYAQYRANPYTIRSDPLPDDAELSTRLWNEMLEDRIYTVVQRMLHAYPLAANHIAASGYTMLHSAVFHGRCARTVKALINAAGRVQVQSQSEEEEKWRRDGDNQVVKISSTSRGSLKRARTTTNSRSTTAPRMNTTTMTLADLILQPNISQHEVPLHICTMRGEGLPTLSLLAEQGPRAVFARDIHGRTPMLWMWIHYCSTKHPSSESADEGLRMYSCKELESPLTYLNMRHVPGDYLDRDLSKRNRLVELLHPFIAKLSNSVTIATGMESLLTFLTRLQQKCDNNFTAVEDIQDTLEQEGYQQRLCASPEEAGALLLWEKALCLLRACASSTLGTPTILHVAAAHPCVPSSIVHIALSLYSQFAGKADHVGRLPLHCAASRCVYKWKPSPFIPALVSSQGQMGRLSFSPRSREQIISEPIVAAVLDAFPEGVKVFDNCNRLPLHYAIESVVKSISFVDKHEYYLPNNGDLDLWNSLVKPLLVAWPGSVDQIDGVTKLYPFMQVAAEIEHTNKIGIISRSSEESTNLVEDQMSVRQLNVIYGILRINPELVRLGIKEASSNETASQCSEYV